MCGIVAYVGRKIAQPLLIEGLKRLEYRGYDSAGIAVIDDAGRAAHPPGGRADQRAGELDQPATAAARRRTSAWPTPAGPRTAPRPKSTPTRTPTTPAASRWSTTASSKTTPP